MFISIPRLHLKQQGCASKRCCRLHTWSTPFRKIPRRVWGSFLVRLFTVEHNCEANLKELNSLRVGLCLERSIQVCAGGERNPHSMMWLPPCLRLGWSQWFDLDLDRSKAALKELWWSLLPLLHIPLKSPLVLCSCVFSLSIWLYLINLWSPDKQSYYIYFSVLFRWKLYIGPLGFDLFSHCYYFSLISLICI